MLDSVECFEVLETSLRLYNMHTINVDDFYDNEGINLKNAEKR